MTSKAFAAVLAATTIITAASAQEPLDATPTNISVRLGGFLPFDQDLRDVNDGFIGVGIDVQFTQQFLAKSQTFLSIDWLGQSFSGSKGNIFPICVNQKFWLGERTEMGSNPYVFAGIGATIFDISTTNTQLGLRAGAGMNLGPNIFAEGTLYWSDKSTGDIDGTGLGLYIGYRW